MRFTFGSTLSIIPKIRTDAPEPPGLNFGSVQVQCDFKVQSKQFAIHPPTSHHECDLVYNTVELFI